MNNSGIPARFTGLSAALLQHCVAIISLAGVEARQLFKRSAITFFIVVCIFIFIFISYIALLAMLIAVAMNHYGVTCEWALGSVALVHLIIAGLLILVLRCTPTQPAFAVTLHELQRDIDSLTAASSSSNEKR